MTYTTEQLRKIAENAHALIQLRKESGFQTRRAVVNLLSPLSEKELLEVSKMIVAMSTQGASESHANNLSE